jgi:hypothetical protein
MASGLLCLLIVASSYSPDDAGKIYTILSMAGFAMFFEIGLPTLVLQRMSLLTRSPQWNAQDLVGNSALISPVFNHYLSLVLVQAFMLLALLLPAGLYVIFNIFDASILAYGPLSWALACLAMVLILPAALFLNTLEGLGYINVVAKIRMLQSIASAIALNLALFLKFSYPSIAIQLLCAMLAVWAAIFYFESKFTKSLFSLIQIKFIPGRVSLDWGLQWRLILSFVSGYFSNQAWVVMIALSGAVVMAGQVGMTLQALTALVAFSLTPFSAKFPLLSASAHKETLGNYLGLVKNLMKHSIIIYFVITSVCLAIYFMGEHTAISLNAKFLSFGPLIIIGLSSPFILTLGGMTMLNQSLGRDDLYIISILKIVVPIIFILIFWDKINEWSFAVCYACIAITALLLGVMIHRRSHYRIFYEN